MAEQFLALNDELIDFIQQQPLFFVGTAGAAGKVNVSPKGLDSLRILSPTQIIWLNLTGSGNECAAHVLENQRMTLMFCSFSQKPLILRAYGRAKMIYEWEDHWQDYYQHFPEQAGSRQIFDLSLDLLITSCGYGVPKFSEMEERPTLTMWANKKGEQGIKDYWHSANAISLDGESTGIK